jgi:ATPase subunit of ABC transporter with duplicated ATPase domains
LVTHDRYFLDQVTKWTLELDRGKGIPYEGHYSGWLEQKTKRIVQEQSESEARQRAMTRELEWVRSGAKARQAKNKARLGRYDEMVAEAEKTRKLDFEEIQIPVGPRLGSVVVEVEHLDKGYDGRILIKDLSFTLPRNGIVGVIGPNGVGKTTTSVNLAAALQMGAVVYLVGATFQGIGYQPVMLMLVGLQIGLASYCARIDSARALRQRSEQRRAAIDDKLRGAVAA